MSDGAAAWSEAPDGLVVTVRLTPRGGRDALDGIERLADGRAVLKARVRAAPTDGEANAALLALFAKTLRLPSRAVTLVAGDTARIKRIKILGEARTLAAALASATGADAA